MIQNPTLGHTSGKKHNPKGYMHPYAHSGTINSSQDVGTAEVSIKGGMDKGGVVHTYIQWSVPQL